jgi:solute:Na+ symporter, SSS family
VVEIGLTIASVLWGAMLGVFLLGTLSRRATEPSTIVGMLAGCLVNVLLWLQPGTLSFNVASHLVTFPKIAWTWYVLIGSMVTSAIGYGGSLIFPRESLERNHERSL